LAKKRICKYNGENLYFVIFWEKNLQHVFRVKKVLFQQKFIIVAKLKVRRKKMFDMVLA
jgi:hypothetical protein